MFNLPQEIIDLIYEFDCTKKENFDKVIEDLEQKIKNARKQQLELYEFPENSINAERLEFSWVNGCSCVIQETYTNATLRLERQLNQKFIDLCDSSNEWKRRYKYKYILKFNF